MQTKNTLLALSRNKKIIPLSGKTRKLTTKLDGGLLGIQDPIQM